MGRLFLLASVLLAVGIVMADDRGPSIRPAATAETPATAPTVAPIAHRPGEPMLVPGQTVELQRGANGHFHAEVSVNGRPVTMLVDTGATTIALSVGDACSLGLPVDPATFAVIGSGASGPVKGATVTLNSVALGARQAGPIRAVVVDGLDRSLLGQSFLSKMEVQITGDTMTLR